MPTHRAPAAWSSCASFPTGAGSTRTVMWRLIGAVLLVLCAVSTIPFGAWIIAKSRLPSWMKGIWKWPLGENLSPEVVYWQGWAAVVVCAAALVTLIPLLSGPDVTATSRAGLALVVLFLIVGVGAQVRSVVLF